MGVPRLTENCSRLRKEGFTAFALSRTLAPYSDTVIRQRKLQGQDPYSSAWYNGSSNLKDYHITDWLDNIQLELVSEDRT